MSQAYQRKNDKDKAIQALEKAVEIDPMNQGFKNQLQQLKTGADQLQHPTSIRLGIGDWSSTRPTPEDRSRGLGVMSGSDGPRHCRGQEFEG
jgi:hypothetical protein